MCAEVEWLHMRWQQQQCGSLFFLPPTWCRCLHCVLPLLFYRIGIAVVWSKHQPNKAKFVAIFVCNLIRNEIFIKFDPLFPHCCGFAYFSRIAVTPFLLARVSFLCYFLSFSRWLTSTLVSHFHPRYINLSCLHSSQTIYTHHIDRRDSASHAVETMLTIQLHVFHSCYCY